MIIVSQAACRINHGFDNKSSVHPPIVEIVETEGTLHPAIRTTMAFAKKRGTHVVEAARIHDAPVWYRINSPESRHAVRPVARYKDSSARP